MTRYGHIDMELAGMPAEEVDLRTFGNGQYYGRFMLTPTRRDDAGTQQILLGTGV